MNRVLLGLLLKHMKNLILII